MGDLGRGQAAATERRLGDSGATLNLEDLSPAVYRKGPPAFSGATEFPACIQHGNFHLTQVGRRLAPEAEPGRGLAALRSPLQGLSLPSPPGPTSLRPPWEHRPPSPPAQGPPLLSSSGSNPHFRLASRLAFLVCAHSCQTLAATPKRGSYPHQSRPSPPGL